MTVAAHMTTALPVSMPTRITPADARHDQRMIWVGEKGKSGDRSRDVVMPTHSIDSAATAMAAAPIASQ